MPTFSEPFRLYLIKDPLTGKRRQLADEAEARAIAKELAVTSGRPVSSILVSSKYWYCSQYADGGKVRRINTKMETKHEARKWRDARSAMALSGHVGFTKKPLAEAIDIWLKEKQLGAGSRKGKPLRPKTLRDYRVLSSGWKDFFGEGLVSDIAHEDLVRFFDERAAGKIGGRERKEELADGALP